MLARWKTLFATSLAGAALLVAAPVAAAQVTFTLPQPSGVGTTSIHLVDQGRADPWKPDRKRELMISVWYPARDTNRHPRAPWATPGLGPVIDAFMSDPVVGIPSGAVNWGGATAGHVNAPVDRKPGGRPVVLYSAGSGGPRFSSTSLVQDLASHGYVVITIDHTFETAVEFPGGRVEFPVPLEWTPEVTKRMLDARVADTRFVLDQLPKLNRDVLRGAMNLSRVGMFGHSFGGMTAGETMFHDRRIKAGINMDGAMLTSRNPYVPAEITKHGVDRPFMLMGSTIIDENGNVQDHTHTNPFDPSWVEFWANQRGWKADLLLRGGSHHSYSDLQTILPQLAKPLNLPPDKWPHLLGTIDPAKSLKLQTTRIRGFFDRFV
jgi:dienelactone hydrolase